MFRRLPYLVPFVLVLVAVPLVTHAQVVNLLEDPSFENEIIIGNTAWNRWLTWAAGGAVNSTIEIDKTEFMDGEKSLRVIPSGTGQFAVIYAAIPLEVGERYTVSFWAKAEAPRTVQARLQAMNNSSMETADFQLTTEWAEYTFTAEAPNASIKLQIQWNASVEVPYWLDFVSLYAGEYVAGIEPSGLSRVKAADPDPVDGAVDVPRDVVLSWTPGEFADLHDVYFGTSFDDVNNATATVDLTGVYRGRLSDSSYAVDERLDFGQTYYWRIDEVNAPPDSTIFKGDVWQFAAELIAYPIENITATASSKNSANEGPEKTIYGSGLDADDLHSAENVDMWLSNITGPQPTWIQYEFGRIYKLHQMRVWNHNSLFEQAFGLGVKDATIEHSVDGTNWTTLGTTHEFTRASGAAGYADNTTVDFGDVVAKYVKITANSNWGGIVTQYGLSEVRFLFIPVQAREPNPVSGSTDMDVDNVTLVWRAGREAADHDVYLSINEQAVIDETISPVRVPAGSSFANYDTGALDLNQTYYWKVNEVNKAETPSTWESNIWSFTTTDHLIVDDFEDYDIGNNEIWWSWIDGLGYASHPTLPAHPGNGTGSMVGDETTGSYMEETIVHGGNQSMPVFYDNSILRYSEVEKTLTYPRDWTENGVSTLSIWFRGNSDNAAELLYVVLNDSAVVTHDNPDASLVEDWTEWNIDLQEFAAQGVNLANVNTISIGFGDKNNLQAGGSGMVLFDDIRLYRP